jgi:hypothetical protein
MISESINKDIKTGSKTGQLHSLDNDNRQQLFEDIIQIICKHEYNCAIDKNNLLSVAFRLWAGCLSAAKTIAHGTRDRRNTAEIRDSKFKLIDERCNIKMFNLCCLSESKARPENCAR